MMLTCFLPDSKEDVDRLSRKLRDGGTNFPDPALIEYCIIQAITVKKLRPAAFRNLFSQLLRQPLAVARAVGLAGGRSFVGCKIDFFFPVAQACRNRLELVQNSCQTRVGTTSKMCDPVASSIPLSLSNFRMLQAQRTQMSKKKSLFSQTRL